VPAYRLHTISSSGPEQRCRAVARKGLAMSNPIDVWTHRLRDMTGESDSDPEETRRFVRDLYLAAQADQDEIRAEAEFEREE
jgi:hypothetical protein